MDLNIFKRNIEVLDSLKSSLLRTQYINAFINTSSEFYKLYIENQYKFIDGYCYTGYLWDCLNSPDIADELYVKEIQKKINNVYVLWDIHSCERILVENYWKFEKDAVLSLSMDTLLSGMEHLPEDLYIFDDSFTWTVIFTHENIDGKRYCLKIGYISDRKKT